MKKYIDKWNVPQKDFEAFQKKVIEMAEEEFGVDIDGDCPVDICIVDRTKFDSMQFLLVPRIDWHNQDIIQYRNALHISDINLNIAMSTFKQASNMLQNYEYELAQKDGRNIDAERKEIERLSKRCADLEKENTELQQKFSAEWRKSKEYNAIVAYGNRARAAEEEVEKLKERLNAEEKVEKLKENLKRKS